MMVTPPNAALLATEPSYSILSAMTTLNCQLEGCSDSSTRWVGKMAKKGGAVIEQHELLLTTSDLRLACAAGYAACLRVLRDQFRPRAMHRVTMSAACVPCAA